MLHYSPLDAVFHALADPARRVMVERLSRGPASVGELAGPLAMSLSAVVQHVRVLETSGLIQTEKRGRVRVCRLDPAALANAERWIAERRAGWERRLDRLGDYLAAHPDTDAAVELRSAEAPAEPLHAHVDPESDHMFNTDSPPE